MPACLPNRTMATLKSVQECCNNEELYLTALRLEQDRHTCRQAYDYYVRALEIDPEDVRCNNALGLWYMQRGRFAMAEPRFRTATDVLGRYGLLGVEGEAAYNLALCLKYIATRPTETDTTESNVILAEAYDWASKSTADQAWKHAGYMLCAQISAVRGDIEEALYLVNKAINYCWNSTDARALKAALMNRLQADTEAFEEYCEESLRLNQFNFGVLFEQGRADELKLQLNGEARNYDDLALSYVASGFYDSALSVWQKAIEDGATTAMTYYYMAWITGSEEDAEQASEHAEELVVPERVEAIMALAAFTNDEVASRLVDDLCDADSNESEKLQQIEQYQAERREPAKEILRECAKVHERIKECEMRGVDVSAAEDDFAAMQGKLAKAINLLEECLLLPDELTAVGRNWPNNDIYYLLGRAFEYRGKRLHRNGREFEAERIFSKASKMFRLGSQVPEKKENAGEGGVNIEKMRYVALCYKALGDEVAAEKIIGEYGIVI